MNMKVKIWLEGGTILNGWKLTNSEIKMDGQPFGIDTLDRIVAPYLYIKDGSKVYIADHITGTVSVVGESLNQPLIIPVRKISTLRFIERQQRRGKKHLVAARERQQKRNVAQARRLKSLNKAD